MVENRVYELAREFGMTNNQMIEFLLNNGIEVNSHMSIVPKEAYPLLDALHYDKNNLDHENLKNLKRIIIEGLFGKYDYDIKFEKDINIWVSENGVGKTTILNIIVSILTGNADILTDIDFKKITVFIQNHVYELDKKIKFEEETSQKQLEDLLYYLGHYLSKPVMNKIMVQYKKNGYIDYEYIEKRLMYEYMHSDRYYNTDIVHNDVFYLLKKLKHLQSNSYMETLYQIKSNINESPLFYPTYRRIEISFDKVFSKGNLKAKDSCAEYIGFGMRDVKIRIEQLLEKMQQDANDSYREMNSSIINDLLSGKSLDILSKTNYRINKHKVEVVIKRIGEDRIQNVQKLKEFVQGKIETPNEEFLIFYLTKLVEIYDKQKAIDEKLNKFVNVCNKYLSGKRMRYDEEFLNIDIFDKEDKLIDLEQLSSGEKQIVSIFSKVYLDVTTPCYFIIDEPEISLSIEWQKHFLNDIYDSGKIGLLIATTHSPFIFKNEFRQYTKEIEMYTRS